MPARPPPISDSSDVITHADELTALPNRHILGRRTKNCTTSSRVRGSGTHINIGPEDLAIAEPGEKGNRCYTNAGGIRGKKMQQHCVGRVGILRVRFSLSLLVSPPKKTQKPDACRAALQQLPPYP